VTINTRRATPEKVLFVFAAFLLLAVIVSVRDCRARDRIEWSVPVSAANR
jgi:hypothetical protein